MWMIASGRSEGTKRLKKFKPKSHMIRVIQKESLIVLVADATSNRSRCAVNETEALAGEPGFLGDDGRW